MLIDMHSDLGSGSGDATSAVSSQPERRESFTTQPQSAESKGGTSELTDSSSSSDLGTANDEQDHSRRDSQEQQQQSEETQYVPTPHLPLSPIMAEFVIPNTRLYKLHNAMGLNFTILDESGEQILKGRGKMACFGYNVKLFDMQDQLLLRMKSRPTSIADHYEIKLPNKQVIATGRRSMFQRKTSVHVFAGQNLDAEVCRIKGDILGGEFSVSSCDGLLLATIDRNIKKGMLVAQGYSVVVQAGADALLMLMLAIMCNCMKNDRNKLVVSVGAVFAATILV